MSRTVEIPVNYDSIALKECAEALLSAGYATLAERFRQHLPRRPAEPKGLGAVVRDGYGRRWIRVAPEPYGMAWFNNGNAVPLQAWGDVQAVEILSEGWQG